MKLAVSNIAWGDGDEAAVLKLLAPRGITGIEIAPTRIWPDWRGATRGAARLLRRQLDGEGFAVPALQAILFDRPALTLFGDAAATESFIDHVCRVADLAAALGAGVLVYGAPKSRDRGALDAAAAFERATAVFARLGALCAERGTVLGLEPNPPAYGCNFITQAADGLALVQAVDSPGFRLHLDSAAMSLGGDEPETAIAASRHRLAHFHASEPHLAPLAPGAIDHSGCARALRRAGYTGWVSVEMRRVESPLRAIGAALDHAIACYRGRPETEPAMAPLATAS